jgi:hypothetical protein
MDLREFLSETLVQIQMGVQDAITKHQALPDSVGVINPVWGADASAISSEHVQKVEFDVAVTVTDKTGGSGKGGLKIFSLEMGAEASKSIEQSSVSRIKFSIPIVPAVQIVTSGSRS